MQNMMITTIKEVENKSVCMFKIGNFYHVFGKDADIISGMFGYKVKNSGVEKECGFPIQSINKVKAKLEVCLVNYVLIDRRNNYAVDEKMDFEDKNRYNEYYEKGNRIVNLKIRVNNICEYLNSKLQEIKYTKLPIDDKCYDLADEIIKLGILTEKSIEDDGWADFIQKNVLDKQNHEH